MLNRQVASVFTHSVYISFGHLQRDYKDIECNKDITSNKVSFTDKMKTLTFSSETLGNVLQNIHDLVKFCVILSNIQS